MIVVVGLPAWRQPGGREEAGRPAGRAAEVALAAAALGARVELVGRTGDDPDGDALLLGLSRGGVGHAAMLRDPARPTPVVQGEPLDSEGPEESVGGVEPSAAAPSGTTPALTLEPEDVTLGLRYLTDYRVLVVVDTVPASVLPVAAEATGYAGAHLIVLVPAGAPAPAGLPDASTALAAPDSDDGAFARLVGGYAAALDGGTSPAEAFAVAASSAGWEAIEA